RKRFILTIDPAESRDFDDALSFAILPDGNRELGVHIADVAHYVRPGSALDREAFKRGNSVYLADKVIPMLPEALSNGICSLRPRVERLCFSVFIVFDKSGRPVSRSFARSVIRSSLRLNYGQALAIIEGRRPDGIPRLPKAARELLTGANALARQLRATRMKNGALDLDIPECRVNIDADGRMTGFTIEEYDASHQLIEECMVAANEAVAAELSLHGVRIVSRLHEPPDPMKIDDLATSLKALGFRPGDISNPANLSRFIASIESHPLRAQAHTLILRSMKRALYSADGHGHFGLAKARYSHFTSPIRRYADLVLHRQLADYIARRRQSVRGTALPSIAARCTETELRADEAERTLLEIKKFRFLQDQLDRGDPQDYDATVSKVTPFGMFVDLPALAVGGLVHISAISDRFVRLDHAGTALVAGSRRWALGDTVRVRIARVEFQSKRLDFTLADREPDRGCRGKTRKSPRRGRR
ncbi:MAG: RNB domain-containing ribonuclease, partial [Kiritimatiellae bacterium]|nr:RNB domain-containing ribonuclease [Kiritimatiellia bacterium]